MRDEKRTKKELSKKHDEEMSNRILVVFCAGLLMLLGIMFLNRLMINYKTAVSTRTASLVLGLIFCVLGVASITVSILKRKTAAVFQTGRLALLGCICIVFSGSLLLIYLRPSGAFKLLYAALPVLAFMYMIYNIFQRDFFWQSVVVGCTGAVLYAFSRWLHYKPWQPIVHFVYITAIVMLAAGIVMSHMARKNSGRVFGFRVFPHSANYRLMFITLILMMSTIITVLIVGSSAAFWAMAGVFAYLLVLGVYYTIRLM